MEENKDFSRGKPEFLPTDEEISAMFSGTRCLPTDIETTGIKDEGLHIVELGIAEVIDGVVTNTGSRIFGGGKSEPKALEVHGITDESRAGKPTFFDKAPYFKRLLERRTFMEDGKERPNIWIGHNILKFDSKKLINACKTAGCPLRTPDGYIYYVDTLKLAREHLSAPSFKLEELCPSFGITHGGHRALGDALSCWYLLHIIMKRARIPHVNNIKERITL